VCPLLSPYLPDNQPSLTSRRLLGNPFRESGPPANMAKLILLRHKVFLFRVFSASSTFSHFSSSRFKQLISDDATLHLPAVSRTLAMFPVHSFLTPRTAGRCRGCESVGIWVQSSIIKVLLSLIFPPHLPLCNPHAPYLSHRPCSFRVS
jgi:hypothetical protein